MKWTRGFQFSLRTLFWVMAAVSMVFVAVRGNPFWAAAISLLAAGAAMILHDCLSNSESQAGAAQLLVGALCVALACGLMFAAAYGQWIANGSGTFDYVTFAVGLFAFCYAVWVRLASEARLRLTSQLGYFAFVLGAFMLNHVLFDTVIRRLR